MKSFTRIMIVAFVMSFALAPRAARADGSREFILSCSYGVLAGTLVGAASLAFSDKPGENLNKVARGASIGLYAGILLGLYVASGAGTHNDDEDVAQMTPPRLLVAPVVSDRGFEGAEARYTVLNF